jgi:hypothetical protein
VQEDVPALADRIMRVERLEAAVTTLLRETPNVIRDRLTIEERAMATLQLPELALSFQMAGRGTPLVFIHQVATDHRLWRRQCTYFRARYRAPSPSMC